MMAQIAWSRQAVLGLYRRLLREGTNLQYTDQHYYKRCIQKEFRAHIAEKGQPEQQRQLDVSLLLEIKMEYLMEQ